MAVSVSLSQHVFIKTAVVDENEVDVSSIYIYILLTGKLAVMVRAVPRTGS